MPRVLVVEPDRQVRQFISGILADLGHHVEQCRDATDARRRLRVARFDVLATDLMHDAEKAGELPALAKGLPVLTLSGRRFMPGVDTGDRPARLRDKPFRFDDLTTLVGAVFRYAAATSLPAA